MNKSCYQVSTLLTFYQLVAKSMLTECKIVSTMYLCHLTPDPEQYHCICFQFRTYCMQVFLQITVLHTFHFLLASQSHILQLILTQYQITVDSTHYLHPLYNNHCLHTFSFRLPVSSMIFLLLLIKHKKLQKLASVLF